MAENKVTEIEEDQNILDTKKIKRREKKIEAISFKNLKSTIALKPLSNPKKKPTTKILKQSIPNNNKKKRVKINEDVTIIDVECWKEYNLEQTADENSEDFTEDTTNVEEVKEIKIKKKDKNRRINNKNDISCTCLII